MKRTAIENGSLELLKLFQEISEEARNEKNSMAPLSKMMYWWTRKPLVVARAVALASTLNDVDHVRKLLKLKMNKRTYNYLVDTAKYKTWLKNPPSSFLMLDPFGGTGNFAFEAKCLGLTCTTSDYNPIAYMIQKSTLEYPALFGSSLADDVAKYSQNVIDLTKHDLSKFFSDDTNVYFWFWCIKCPFCQQQFPLTNHMYIVNTSKKQIGIEISPTNDYNFIVKIKNPISKTLGQKFTQKQGKALCIRCQNTIDHKYMTNYIAEFKDRRLLFVQTQTTKGKTYRLASDQDHLCVTNASKFLSHNLKKFHKHDLIPTNIIRSGNTPIHSLSNYGIKTWNDFVSDRQLLVMTTFLSNCQKVLQTIADPEYRKAISVYLGFLLCRHLNHNALPVRFHTRTETPTDVLSLRSLGMVFNHVEVNPFVNVSGGFKRVLSNILSALKFALRCSGTPTVNLQSVLQQYDKKFDLIITDPPYADDVHYGERSEFFYGWFYRCVRDNFPELPRFIDLTEDFCEAPGRFKSTTQAKLFFAEGLQRSFLSMRDSLKADGLLVVFFAHSTTSAWDLLLKCIVNANLRVMSAHAVHTESVNSLLSRNRASIMSSIVVTCRKITTESEIYLEDLKPKIFYRIDELLDQLTQNELLDIPVTDLLIMVYGEVLELSTGYTKLKSYEQNTDPTFDCLMNEARKYMMKKLLSKVAGKHLESLMPTTSIYILVKVFYNGKLHADEFSKLIKTYGVSTTNFLDSVLVLRKGQFMFSMLHLSGKNLIPTAIDLNDIYSQLAYVAHLTHSKGINHVKPFLASSDASLFKPDKLRELAALLSKAYTYHIRRSSLNSEAQVEFEILKNLSDILGANASNSQLNEYFPSGEQAR